MNKSQKVWLQKVEKPNDRPQCLMSDSWLFIVHARQHNESENNTKPNFKLYSNLK